MSIILEAQTFSLKKRGADIQTRGSPCPPLCSPIHPSPRRLGRTSDCIVYKLPPSRQFVHRHGTRGIQRKKMRGGALALPNLVFLLLLTLSSFRNGSASTKQDQQVIFTAHRVSSFRLIPPNFRPTMLAKSDYRFSLVPGLHSKWRRAIERVDYMCRLCW